MELSPTGRLWPNAEIVCTQMPTYCHDNELRLRFMVAYVQVAAFRADRDAWEATGKPMAEFRKTVKRDHPATDVACASFLVLGAGLLLWGLFRRFDELGDRDFTIGSDPAANFQIGPALKNMCSPTWACARRSWRSRPRSRAGQR